MTNIITKIEEIARNYISDNPESDLVKWIDLTEDLSSIDSDSHFFETYIDMIKERITSNPLYVYNDEAIKYLLENDSGLDNSISIAVDNEYELHNVGSCLLANLLLGESLLAGLEEYSEFIKKELNIND